MKLRYILIIVILGALATIPFIKFNNKHQQLENGYIEGNYTYLSSPSAGKLISLSVFRGNTVTQGEELFKLDPNPELANSKAAQANLEAEKYTLQNLIQGSRSTILGEILADKTQMEANLRMSTITLKRYTKLYKENNIAKAALDQVNTNYKNDLQKLKKINAQLSEAKLGARKNLVLAQQEQTRLAEINLNKTTWALQQKTISAPKQGLIFNTFYNLGEYIPAGKPVLALLTADNVKVIFFINEKNLSQIKLNGKIKFHTDGQEQWHPATIDYISPQAEYTPPLIYSRDSRNKLVYRVEASLPSKTALQYHPGQPIDVNYGD